ncbi:MAG: signal peptidase [Friedmanniella sp.]|nr:signal peptidase [Friedmanniella sp.]
MVVGAVVVASLLRGFVGQMFIIPSESMENTLLVNDRVVVEKLTKEQRGEVVVFADPGGWLSGESAPARGPVGRALQFVGVLPDTSTEHLIKRIVGLPGDHIICCDNDGRLSVNGRSLDESDYLADPSEPSSIRFDVVVPDQRIFVMGDNRGNSRDSRCHLNDVAAGEAKGENAFVSEDLVVGRAIAVVWPFERRHRLPIPASLAGVPAATTPAPAAATIDAGAEASC